MSIEGRIADTVLKKIRARRSVPPQPAVDGTSLPPSAAQAVSVREAQFSDFERVCALNLRLGQGPDSPENWKRLWLHNPAIADGKAASRIGWLLEASGEVVGFLGSIPLLYEFEGNTLIAAATCRFAVEPAYRGFSHLLIASFFRQKNVDLFLNTSATPSAGKIVTALKALPLPQRDYETVLFWVIDPRQFTKAVLRKVGVHGGLLALGSSVASLGLRGDIAIRRRVPRSKSSGYSIVETSVNEMGPEFERFWSEKSTGTPRLQAKRTPAIMRWHFDPPANRRKAKVLACHVGNHLAGYAIVRHEPEAGDGIRRSLIADLMIQGDDPRIVQRLLAASYNSAKVAGCHVLEVMGFPQGIRQVLLQTGPYMRKYPACPFFYKARDRALSERLADENAWYACPFDGDATLWP